MSSKSKLIINCGATHVSASVFGVSAGRLVLESFQVQELKYDYSNQDEWFAELAATLKMMKVSGKATIIAPSMLLLTKTIKTPHVDKARQAEVVMFEAQKNIPYPIDQMSLDYEVVSDDGVETEIFLASMKSTVADELCAALAQAKIVPEAIEASPILDYNAWKYCGLESDVIILNVGSRFTNMMIVRDDGVFVRSIPVGGNSLTQSVADSLGRDFQTAEELKLKFFANASEFSSSHGAEHFTNGANSVMRRIGIEIKRSIVNYKRSSRVESPTKIYLCGRGSLIPGFAEFLAEDQKMSVEYFDALSNVAVGPKVDQQLVSSNSAQFSEIIGEAARMVVPNLLGVNLLPKHIVDEIAFAKTRPLMLLGAAVLFAATIPPMMMFTKSIQTEDKAERKFQSMMLPISDRAEEFKQNGKIADSLEAKINGLEGLARSKSNWINLFIDIEKRLMEQKDVWLDNLKVHRAVNKEGVQEYKLELTGRLLIRDVNPENPQEYDTKKAIDRITNLLNSFVSSSFLKSYENVKTDPSNPRILKFDFTLVVNPDKPI